MEGLIFGILRYITFVNYHVRVFVYGRVIHTACVKKRSSNKAKGSRNDLCYFFQCHLVDNKQKRFVLRIDSLTFSLVFKSQAH